MLLPKRRRKPTPQMKLRRAIARSNGRPHAAPITLYGNAQKKTAPSDGGGPMAS